MWISPSHLSQSLSSHRLSPALTSGCSLLDVSGEWTCPGSVVVLGRSVSAPKASSFRLSPSVGPRRKPRLALSGSVWRLDSSVRARGPPTPAAPPGLGPGSLLPWLPPPPPRGAASPMRAAAAGSAWASASFRLPRHGQRLMPVHKVRIRPNPAPPVPLKSLEGCAGEPQFAGSGPPGSSPPSHGGG